jgi:hypothetical protein
VFHSRDLYSGDGAVQLSAEVIITSLFSKTMLGVENRAKSKGGRVTAYVPLARSRCDCANRDVANLELAGSAKGAVFALTLSRLVGPVTIVASPRLAVQKATFHPLACTGVDEHAVTPVTIATTWRSQSVSRQTDRGCPHFYPVWQSYTHTGPGVLSNGTTTKSDGTPRYAAPAAKVMLSMDPRWYCTRLMHIHQQGGYEDEKCNTIQLQ